MRKQILKSLMVIGLVAASTTVAATQALFTDSVTVRNNTFSTGNVMLKLYYNESYEGSSGTGTCGVGGIYNSIDGPVSIGDGAVVACNDGSGNADVVAERVALIGAQESSLADYDSTHHWYDDLSSVFDYTNMAPGSDTYTSYGATGSIKDGNLNSVAGDGRIVTVANAGTLDQKITINLEHESSGLNETLEPGDGTYPGGLYLDPYNDTTAVAAGYTYDANGTDQTGNTLTDALANYVWVQIEVVDAAENSQRTLYRGTLATFPTAGVVDDDDANNVVALPSGEVRYYKFNYQLDPDAPNDVQKRLTDISFTFNGENI